MELQGPQRQRMRGRQGKAVKRTRGAAFLKLSSSGGRGDRTRGAAFL